MSDEKVLIQSHQEVNLREEIKISATNRNTTRYALNSLQTLLTREDIRQDVDELHQLIKRADHVIAWKKLNLQETTSQDQASTEQETPSSHSENKTTPQEAPTNNSQEQEAANAPKQLAGEVVHDLPKKPVLETVYLTLTYKGRAAMQADADNLLVWKQITPVYTQQATDEELAKKVTAYLQEHVQVLDAVLRDNAVVCTLQAPTNIRTQLIIQTDEAQAISDEFFLKKGQPASTKAEMQLNGYKEQLAPNALLLTPNALTPNDGAPISLESPDGFLSTYRELKHGLTHINSLGFQARHQGGRGNYMLRFYLTVYKWAAGARNQPMQAQIVDAKKLQEIGVHLGVRKGFANQIRAWSGLLAFETKKSSKSSDVNISLNFGDEDTPESVFKQLGLPVGSRLDFVLTGVVGTEDKKRFTPARDENNNKIGAHATWMITYTQE